MLKGFLNYKYYLQIFVFFLSLNPCEYSLGKEQYNESVLSDSAQDRKLSYKGRNNSQWVKFFSLQ